MSIKVNCRILEQSGGSSGRKRLRRAQPGAEAAAETAAHRLSMTAQSFRAKHHSTATHAVMHEETVRVRPEPKSNDSRYQHDRAE